MEERLYNIDEASEFLGVPKGTIFNWIARGVIPVIRISSRMVRFSPQQLKEWLDSKSQAANLKPNKKCGKLRKTNKESRKICGKDTGSNRC